MISHEAFWRLQARILECQQRRAEFETLIEQRRVAMLVEAGLDPAKHYRLDEETLTVSEIDPSGV